MGRGVLLYKQNDDTIARSEHTELWHVQFRAEKDRHRQQQVHTSPEARVRHSREVLADSRSNLYQVSGERTYTSPSAQLHSHS